MTPAVDSWAGLLDLPGLRTIRPLLTDPSVSEIMINGPDRVFVERSGRMEPAGIRFETAGQLEALVETLLRPSGRRVDAQQPMVDARLPDGSRVNVVLAPLALEGPVITIRKFTGALREVQDLVRIGTLSPRMALFLEAAVRARINLLFCGATGSGKTTTVGILSRVIPDSERIVTIEDTAELDLRQSHVVRLECRQPNVEGKGAVTLEELLRNSLRMRPTRIILGEIRGAEAVELLQAIRSGHDGCMAVMHASSPRDAIGRLELMTLSRGLYLPLWAVRQQVGEALDLIVQHEQLADGSRMITYLTEVVGVEDEEVALRDLFTFRNRGPDESGTVQGEWLCSGVEPAFLERFGKWGVPVPDGLFQAGEE